MKKIWMLISIVAGYFLLQYYGGATGQLILYPIIIIVTILHELGHAFFALITGGSVHGIAIDPSTGAGVTSSSSSYPSVVAMGGYIGSAIFGNLLFYIGAAKKNLCAGTMYGLSILMIFTGIIWFGTVETTITLIAYAVVFWFLSKQHTIASIALMVIGVVCTAYIIQDFDGGPSSDLQQFAGVLGASLWSYIWLGIVLCITIFNARVLLKQK